MNKKNIIIGITCGFILVAGVCYSLTFVGCSPAKSVSTSLTNRNTATPYATGIDQNSQQASDRSEANAKDVTKSPDKVNKSAKIYVHICGAVKNPGVYRVETGARISDLIKLSGGLKKSAAGDYVNQAQVVNDGERIYIPKMDEIDKLSPDELIQGGQDTSENESQGTSDLININTASAEELMTLPGIGQAKADSIIEYRKTNGNFKAIDELMNITGIKEGVFNRISPLISAE